MTRRPYTKLRRAEAEAATRERIVRATVDLHAEHGVTATSYGMIAEKAGVSPQTVYNHFPKLDELIEGCTSHVQQRAPVVDATCFAGERTAAQRLRKLAMAVYAQLEFIAPWMRFGWGEAERVPALRAVFGRNEAALRDLLAQAVMPDFRADPAFLDAALVLLDYPAWKHLTERRSRVRAAALAGDCLVALLETLCQASPKDRS
ncbi:putative TetR/AcrR-family transcriptional regulator [Methylococcus capsulatus]|jgi:AcrR family transcriptional regulator|uniref:TetR/AcrR-family transcriptional regulator n=1 Tax=Methylococcus capsulatus TaxID=414 RepID=A0AA35UQJ4_METCP|nr:TetR/AcrR family transcriptional regulator [Methylococcus capsulatus]CAI8801288.1 putative TetR/AcrR-family transcriptional regulator [Methylococcus capsulatus]